MKEISPGTSLNATNYSNMEPHKKPTFSKRTDDAWRDWSYTKERIGQQLKKYYQAYTTEELPPRLVALMKKLDEEHPKD